MPSEQRGKRQKQPFRAPTDPVAKIGHVGVYFAKTGCKIEDGFTDILGFQLLDIASGLIGVLLSLNSTRSTHKFCSQKKKAVANFAMAQPSLFFP